MKNTNFKDHEPQSGGIGIITGIAMILIYIICYHISNVSHRKQFDNEEDAVRWMWSQPEEVIMDSIICHREVE
jgi:hypothetical protein